MFELFRERFSKLAFALRMAVRTFCHKESRNKSNNQYSEYYKGHCFAFINDAVEIIDNIVNKDLAVKSFSATLLETNERFTVLVSSSIYFYIFYFQKKLIFLLMETGKFCSFDKKLPISLFLNIPI
jgi:hypothetical protein